jgi:hypothetical protein
MTMIRGRESSDRWARYAHHLLDRVRKGGKVAAERIDWALAYLGDKPGTIKVPPLTGRQHWRPAAHPAPARAWAEAV